MQNASPTLSCSHIPSSLATLVCEFGLTKGVREKANLFRMIAINTAFTKQDPQPWPVGRWHICNSCYWEWGTLILSFYKCLSGVLWEGTIFPSGLGGAALRLLGQKKSPTPLIGSQGSVCLRNAVSWKSGGGHLRRAPMLWFLPYSPAPWRHLYSIREIPSMQQKSRVATATR